MRALVMSASKATSLRKATQDDSAVLLPRKIDAGPHAGKYALNVLVLTDPAFADLKLDALTETEIDPAEAWPETE